MRRWACGLGLAAGMWATALPTPAHAQGTATTFIKISAGAQHSAAIRADGTLWTWGQNNEGQVGDGTATTRLTPVQIALPAGLPPGTRWAHVSCGGFHTLALTSDGTLWGWGSNNIGQVGNASTQPSQLRPVRVQVPTTVTPGSSWVQISAGASHSLALRSDGTGWAWGANLFGSLADGTTNTQTAPVAIRTPAGAAAGTTWRQLSAGTHYSLALRSDNTAWGWGHNIDNVVGDGTTATRYLPVRVLTSNGAAPWTSIHAGLNVSIGRCTDGTLWAWGQGRVGNGYYGREYAPTLVYGVNSPTNAHWQAVDTRNGSVMALRTDGTLWGYGFGGSGELGQNSLNGPYSPEQEFSRSIWQQVAAGSDHTLALGTDGQVYATGGACATYNCNYGQLGDGTTAGSLVFRRVRFGPLHAASAQALQGVQVAPNPAQNEARVTGVPTTATLYLLDAHGRVLRQQLATHATLSLRGLASGLYLLRVADGPRQASLRLVVK